MARLDQIGRLGARLDRRLDRVRPVGRGDAGGDAVARFDRHREGGAEGGLVVLDHLRQVELVALLRGQRHADEAAAVHGHEVDGLRGGELGRHGQVALVLPVLVVADNDDLAGA